MKLRGLTILISLVLINGCSSYGLSGNIKDKAEKTYSTNSLISGDQAQYIAAKYFYIKKKVEVAEPENEIEDNEENAIYNESESGENKKKEINPYYDIINPEFKKLYSTSSLDKKKEIRNEMIDDLFILSDYSFNEFKITVFAAKKSFDFGADYYSLLLTGSAALATGGNTSNILSGLATFVTGVRASFDQIVFSENTIEVLVNVMETNRLNRKAGILKKKRLPANEYSLKSTLREVLSMHQEGNIVSALTSLKKTSTTEQIRATKNFDNAQTPEKK